MSGGGGGQCSSFMDLPFQVIKLMSFSSDNTVVMDLTATGIIGRMGPVLAFSSRIRSQTGFSSRTRSQTGANPMVNLYASMRWTTMFQCTFTHTMS